MPRVNEKKKNKAGESYDCGRCAEKIVAGETYFEWSFRYGGTRRQHTSHGHPRPSQLTQSKMSGVYGAIESAEDQISTADCASDIASALTDCAQEVDNVKSEYQGGLDSLPDGLRDAGGPGGETQEKIDALEEFQSSLESAASDIEGEEEPTEAEGDQDLDETKSEWLEGLRTQASDALCELSI